MAKIYGLFGSMTGKLADVVMSVRNGEQIARKYQPTVFNPSTPAQVATRAKLKLASQLSAVMAPVIAIPRQGSASSRNLFVKANYKALSYEHDQADVTLTDVKLTNSVVGLPNMIAVRDESNIITAKLQQAAGTTNVTRVVYCLFSKEADNTLRFVSSKVATEEGLNDWQVTFPTLGNPAVVYAYGVRDNTEVARAKFGDLTALSAETVAKLIVTRTLTESDVTLTETRAVEVPVSTQANTAIENGDRVRKEDKKK